ncbi:MAG: IMPACT family protein [Petrotogales bacterium]
MNCYISLKGRLTHSEKISRSHFTVNSIHCETERKGKEFIQEINGRYSDASHNCWAYLVDNPETRKNYSDAGEPSGTAGSHILGSIEASNLKNIVVVVTRYFGGIKLGIRGLIDAYGGVTARALKEAKKAKYCPGIIVSFVMDYSNWNSFSRVFKEGTDYNKHKITYTDSVNVSIAIKIQMLNTIKKFAEKRNIEHHIGNEIIFVEPFV